METSRNKAAPPLVLCLGLPGSASTWVYNICIYLCGLRQPFLVSMGYSDDSADFLAKIGDADESSAALVLKSHYADAGMRDYVSANYSKCVLSIRDPRDCIVSLMERFRQSFEAALINVKASCDAVMRFRRPDVPLLRYEDRFFVSQQTLSLLQRYLAPAERIDPAVLAQRYSREAVTEFIGTFGQLEPGRMVIHGCDVSDAVTHWHRNHFGDGLSGKWRTRLAFEQKAQANRALAAALLAFGYGNGDTPATRNGPPS